MVDTDMKCPRCKHYLTKHKVGYYHTSEDDFTRPHIGIFCETEMDRPTIHCGCTAGFDYDVIVDQSLRMNITMAKLEPVK